MVTGTVSPVLLTYFTSKDDGGMLTTDPDETYRLSNLQNKTWTRIDGPYWAYPQPASGLVPLYRYVNAAGTDHLFTLDASEGDLAIKYLGYKTEGVCCYVFATRNAAVAYIGQDIQPTNLPGQPMGIVRELYKNHQHVYFASGDPETITSSGDYKVEGTIGWMILKNTPPNPVPGP